MKTPDLDVDLVAIPEIIADSLTQDRSEANLLCERARRHWKEQPGFRRSFKRCDEREKMKMWMNHWLKGLRHPRPNKNQYATPNNDPLTA